VVELDGRRGARRGDPVAVAQRRRRRRAGVDVDEEVALEEDAGADRERRVLVDGQALVLDLHLHQDSRLTRAQVLNRHDLAHVDAGDPHRGLGHQVVGRAEGRADREVVLERDGLREPEVDDRDGHDQRDRTGREVAERSALVASHPP
jgi:hypothetical protein